MRGLVCKTLATVLIALVAPACALGAVTISWNDGVSHTVDLVLINNPDYDGNPVSSELHKVWAPDGSWCQGFQNFYIAPLPVNQYTTGPLGFTVTGNFMGWDDIDLVTKKFNQVKIQDDVTNNTPYVWHDYHLERSDATTTFTFYKTWTNSNGWDAFKGTNKVDYVYAAGGTYVPPTQVFTFGVDMRPITNTAGDATFHYDQWPTYVVPEAGSAAALASGLIGLLAFAKRRR